MSLCRPGSCQSAAKIGAEWIDRTLTNLCVSEPLRIELIFQTCLLLLDGFSTADLGVRVSCGGRAKVVPLSIVGDQ